MPEASPNEGCALALSKQPMAQSLPRTLRHYDQPEVQNSYKVIILQILKICQSRIDRSSERCLLSAYSEDAVGQVD